MTSCVVRCLAFGLPVPHSLRSGQICVLLCNSVTVPVRLRCDLLARSPSSQRASFHILAYRPDRHSLTPAWTVAGNGFTSYRDAADLMALQTAGLIFFAPVLYCASRLNPRLQVAGLPHGLLCLLPTPHRLRHGMNHNTKNQAVQNFF